MVRRQVGRIKQWLLHEYGRRPLTALWFTLTCSYVWGFTENALKYVMEGEWWRMVLALMHFVAIGYGWWMLVRVVSRFGAAQRMDLLLSRMQAAMRQYEKYRTTESFIALAAATGQVVAHLQKYKKEDEKEDKS